jgi:hypothetical protein
VYQPGDLGAVVFGVLLAAQAVQPGIKLALETIDHYRIEAAKALVIDQLIQAVLALDKKMQPALTIVHIEC